jgi:predicted RND superfamily exporter protein
VQSLVTRLLLWSVKHPAAAALLFALVTIFFAAQIPRLEIDASN